MPCHGNTDDHCCYFKGEPCPYIEENTVEGRRWACGLMREHGDWDKVLDDTRYITVVQPNWDQYLIDFGGEPFTCKTWPTKGKSCDCGLGKVDGST